MKKSAIILVLTMNAVVAAAQRPDKFVAFKDTGILNQGLPVKTKNFLSAKSILAPGALILYGFGSLQVEGLKNINVEVKEEVLENNPGFRTHVDDYLQFAPAAGTFLLEAGGIKGKHNLKGKAIIYGIGLVIMTTVVSSLKKLPTNCGPMGQNIILSHPGIQPLHLWEQSFSNRNIVFVQPGMDMQDMQLLQAQEFCVCTTTNTGLLMW